MDAVWYWIAAVAVHSVWAVPVTIMVWVYGGECLRVMRQK